MASDRDKFYTEQEDGDDECGGGCSERMLFEMQISGFFNDLPPSETSESLTGVPTRNKATPKASHWSLSEMLGFGASSSARSERLLTPAWTFRYIHIIICT